MKVLLAACMAALAVVATASARIGPNDLSIGGVECTGQHDVVSCFRQDVHGYRVVISATTITVGSNSYVTGKGYTLSKPVFTRKQVQGVAKVTPKLGASNLLYAGVYCETNWHDLSIMCVPNSVTGFGVSISKKHVVILNVSTGQFMFSKITP